MSDLKTDEGLKRDVGISGLASCIVNFTIGAGIFALPGIVGIQLGAFSIFAYLFCGMMLATIMLCYAEIGSRITNSGGSYAYVEAAFGKFPGFIVNWLFFFGWGILGDAAVMNIIADSLAVVFPIFTQSWLRGILFLLLIGFMVLINVRGARQGIVVVKLITILKLLPLFGIIIFGFGHIQSGNLQWENLPSVHTFGNTVLVLFFAFAGFETSLNVSGEIKNPKRTIPRGILAGGIAVIIIYLLLQTVIQGVLGNQMNAVKDAPLAAAAEKIIGSAGSIVLLFAAAISCFGAVFGDTFCSPRLLYAGAQNGLFPGFMAKVHPKFHTPHRAIIVYALLIFTFSVSGGFKQLAILASGCILVIYLSVILATIKLRLKKEEGAQKTFRVPGGLIVPGFAIIGIAWLLGSLKKWEVLSVMIFIAVISIIYYLMNLFKNRDVALSRNTE